MQEGRTSSPSLSGPVSLMTPREEMLETKYHQPDNCGPPQHYLDHHRQAMLLSLPTKTEVSLTSRADIFSRELLECLECQVLFLFLVKI